MKNEKEIEKIANQEKKVSNLKVYLRISFFLISIAVIIVCISVIINYTGDKMSAVKIIVTLIMYAVLLIAGYFYYRVLSKKLDRLWDIKKLLF